MQSKREKERGGGDGTVRRWLERESRFAREWRHQARYAWNGPVLAGRQREVQRSPLSSLSHLSLSLAYGEFYMLTCRYKFKFIDLWSAIAQI
jgi:hypothetical protein